MRIYGIASGMDTGTMIDQIMALERQPIRNLENRKLQIQTQAEAWNNLNLLLSQLEDRASSLTSEDTFLSIASKTSDSSILTVSSSIDADIGEYNIEVDQIALAERLVSERFEHSGEPLELQGSFTVNGIEINITEEHTLTDIQAIINSTEDIDINAKIVDSRLLIEASQTGEDKLIFEDPEGILDSLGLSTIQEGQNARIFIDGIEIIHDSNYLDSIIDGVSFTLQSEGASNVSFYRNTSTPISAIRSFMTIFNSISGYLKDVQGKNSGILTGDFMVMRLQTSLRGAITDPVENEEIKLLFQLGIEIDRHGKMSLDESTLKSVLEENPSSVYNLFTQEEGMGVADRVGKVIKAYTLDQTGISSTRDETYSRQIKDIDRMIDSIERRLEKREETLIRQFTAMEQALSSLMNQSDWFESQINSLNNTKRR